MSATRYRCADACRLFALTLGLAFLPSVAAADLDVGIRCELRAQSLVSYYEALYPQAVNIIEGRLCGMLLNHLENHRSFAIWRFRADKRSYATTLHFIVVDGPSGDTLVTLEFERADVRPPNPTWQLNWVLPGDADLKPSYPPLSPGPNAPPPDIASSLSLTAEKLLSINRHDLEREFRKLRIAGADWLSPTGPPKIRSTLHWQLYPRIQYWSFLVFCHLPSHADEWLLAKPFATAAPSNPKDGASYQALVLIPQRRLSDRKLVSEVETEIMKLTLLDIYPAEFLDSNPPEVFDH